MQRSTTEGGWVCHSGWSHCKCLVTSLRYMYACGPWLHPIFVPVGTYSCLLHVWHLSTPGGEKQQLPPLWNKHIPWDRPWHSLSRSPGCSPGSCTPQSEATGGKGRATSASHWLECKECTDLYTGNQDKHVITSCHPLPSNSQHQPIPINCTNHATMFVLLGLTPNHHQPDTRATCAQH